ncbi:hypothetical protein HY633_00840 [Candidatus Uhrbacteria bacterium]|nr:hypothetical protein [Candidatus Uhrbacteria bacterium]
MPLSVLVVLLGTLAVWVGWSMPEEGKRSARHEILAGALIFATGAALACQDFREGRQFFAFFDLALIGGFGLLLVARGLRRFNLLPRLKPKTGRKKP